jgi:hypothetical protein
MELLAAKTVEERRMNAPLRSRRNLLLGIGAVAVPAGIAVPLWVRRAFAASQSCPQPPQAGRAPGAGGQAGTPAQGPAAGPIPLDKPPHSNEVLRSAIRRASGAARPLLVAVIPADDMEKWTRGEALGAFLNHATPAELAPLALVDVVCATPDEIRAVVPSAPAGEPLFYLVETDGSGTVTPLDARLAPAPKETDWQAQARAADKNVDDHIHALAALLKRGLLDNKTGLHRWERQAIGAAGATELENAVTDLDAGRSVSANRVERASPAILRASSSGAAHLDVLGSAAAARLTKRPIDGSRWAASSGCGTEIEGDPQPVMIGCGMGHVPDKSRRFLHFFARSF